MRPNTKTALYTAGGIVLVFAILFGGVHLACKDFLDNYVPLKKYTKQLRDMRNYNRTWIAKLPTMTFGDFKKMERNRLELENKVLEHMAQILEDL